MNAWGDSREHSPAFKGAAKMHRYKRSYLALALLASLTGGCSMSSTDTGDIQERIRQATVAACGWQPTAASLLRLAGLVQPGIGALEPIISQIAEQVCTKVASSVPVGVPAPTIAAAPRSIASQPITVTLDNGVAVSGQFVR
jgi:hypothetical protein